jgi:very-short-patch-repair endonuclease/predicted transcriptional regulator of viral defense system
VGHRARAYDAKRSPHSSGEDLAALASRQHAVVSRRQLGRLGFTKDAIRRRVQGGVLLRLYPGVFAVGHVALTADSRRLAAVMACGPNALLSHRAAGAATGLLSHSPHLEITVPRGTRPRDGILIHRSRLIHDEDRSTVRGVPVTSVARTLVDLADVLSEERLAKAVHEAEVGRVFDLRAIERTLDRLPGRTGRHRLHRVLAAHRSEPHFLRSEAERRFKRLCENHSLPRPQFNVNLAGHELDAYWPDADLAVEIDGARTHHTRRAFYEDRARDRRLAVEGIRVVRITWLDLHDEPALAAELRAIRGAAAPATGSPPAPACA